MLTLTRPPESSFEYGEHILHLDLTFDNVLRMFELFEDDLFNDFEKILLSLQMLITDYDLIAEMEFEEQQEIYVFVLKEFLDIDLNKQEENNGPKSMDWKKDAGLIYASFLSEYNLDLIDLQGKLHWDRFLTLFTNLGDKTAFKTVVGYRTMKIPSTKEASEAYREHVQKMKKVYSLEDQQDKMESLENTLDAVASTFSGGGKS